MAQPKQWDVLTIGDVFTDLVMTGFSHWPQPGEEVDAQQAHREIGGGAAITACGLAQLGIRAAVLACVGTDDSEWFGARLQSCGVDMSCLQSIAGQPTGLSVAISTAADRAFFTHRGANQHLSERLKHAEVKALLATARHVHLAFPLACDLLLELVESCRAAGTTVSLDVGWHPAWLADKALRRALRNLDLFLPNEREAALMTGQTEPERMMEFFVAKHSPPVILKLGAAGSASLQAGEFIHAAPLVVTPLDTTGAGDCFDAGFLYGWLKGWPLAECLRLGNFCGAHSTQALGGVAAFPSLEMF
jgi:sugar/nucleoside kinase (ribokinase family)